MELMRLLGVPRALLPDVRYKRCLDWYAKWITAKAAQ